MTFTCYESRLPREFITTVSPLPNRAPERQSVRALCAPTDWVAAATLGAHDEVRFGT